MEARKIQKHPLNHVNLTGIQSKMHDNSLEVLLSFQWAICQRYAQHRVQKYDSS